MKNLYLNTVRDTLTGNIYNDRQVACYTLNKLLAKFGLLLSKPTPAILRHTGKVWPQTALTMVGTKRLDNIRALIEACDCDNIEGDFVECGVWRGGSSIFAAAVCKAMNNNRKIFVCDSFEGLPKPKLKWDLIDPIKLCKYHDILAISEREVIENFYKFGLEENAIFIKGFFANTLKTLPCNKIAVLRADGDMYESTKDILSLYNKVTSGGFVIIDDYFAIEACAIATNEFLADKNAVVCPIDDSGIFFRKP